MKKIIIILLVLFFTNNIIHCQSERISSLLKLVAQGKIEEVRAAMPKLLADYPNEPGVLLLQGVLMEDGLRAVKIYKNIVKNYPNSEWADDAQWRIVQFYGVIGDTLEAKKELEFFRKNYPKSEFLAPATDVVQSSISSAKYDFKSKINTEKAVPKTQTENQRWGLQVGLYSTKSAAEYEKKRFLGMKLRTEIIEKEVDGEIKYAVVIGNYSSKESAEAAKKEVEKKCECTPFVFQKE
ncbi:MAG TPA: SPOR domain-containing protein [Candidatus Kapabacteria bacterium]|nr:SPOR domain-containing protein [Candidatus Kapabacteria bacterium]